MVTIAKPGPGTAALADADGNATARAASVAAASTHVPLARSRYPLNISFLQTQTADVLIGGRIGFRTVGVQVTEACASLTAACVPVTRPAAVNMALPPRAASRRRGAVCHPARPTVSTAWLARSCRQLPQPRGGRQSPGRHACCQLADT